MGPKDSRESDLGNVFPDLQTMRRQEDPSRRRAQLEKSLDTPVVDAALTVLRQGLKEGEDPLYYEVPRREDDPDSGACTRDTDVDGAAVPKQTLPADVGVTPALAPESHDARAVRRTRRPGRNSLRAAVVAVVAVLGPLAVVWILFVRPQGSGEESRQAASARPSAGVAAPSSASAAPTMPSATTPSSAVVAPPAASASVEVGAPPVQTAPTVAPLAPTVKPRTKGAGSKRNPPNGGARPEDDPEMFQ